MNETRDSTWWWKAAAGAMFSMLSLVLVKGCDEWRDTTDALKALSADVKYQIDRVGQRELRLQEVEKNMARLHDETEAAFEKRRELAERLIASIDDRLDRLERYLPERSIRPPNRGE